MNSQKKLLQVKRLSYEVTEQFNLNNQLIKEVYAKCFFKDNTVQFIMLTSSLKSYTLEQEL